MGADVVALVCSPAILEPGATATCPATITVTQADLDAGSIANTATGRAVPPSGPMVQIPSNTVTLLSAAGPAIEATKSASTSNYDSVGDVIAFVISVRNAGNVSVGQVSVTDTNVDAGSVTCPAGTLAPGETAECTARHTVTQGDIEAGQVVNVATASATAPNGLKLTRETNQISVPAIISPKLSLAKSGGLNDTDRNGLADVGETIDYVITATNTGNVIIPQVTITDPMLSSMACIPSASTSLAPGATMRCSRSHVVVPANIADGLIVNTATARGERDRVTFKVSANKVIAATPGQGGKIPVTGTDVLGPLGVGAACLGVGGIAIIAAKRRRRRRPPAIL